MGIANASRTCVRPPSDSASGVVRTRVISTSGRGSSPGALATGNAIRVSPVTLPALIVSMTSANWSSNDPLGSARNL
jgi:hypothetical protein